ncbi:hypothetical protein ACFWRG_31485 [Micromonospora tulbaghiae]|uniref:Uncharacterized protein n=1 Tax=Streptomyces bacillaris TaxID=68179 RepID=A0ABW6E4V9_9ACTN|nr:hypothetical protein [Streptomyces nanshensis]
MKLIVPGFVPSTASTGPDAIGKASRPPSGVFGSARSFEVGAVIDLHHGRLRRCAASTN